MTPTAVIILADATSIAQMQNFASDAVIHFPLLWMVFVVVVLVQVGVWMFRAWMGVASDV